MYAYLIKRLLLFPVTLLLASIIIFAVLRILPGDVAHVILAGGGEATYTQQQYERLREELRLNRPLAVQYFAWLGDIARLDLGTSMYFKTPVVHELQRRLPLTFQLALMSWVFAMVLGITLGVLMAVKQDTWIDYVLRILAIGGVTMPTYWTGSLIILFLVVYFHWVPPIGVVNLWEDPVTNLQQFIFPALALGYLYAALISRMTRSTMLEVLRQDYMRTAWAKGLHEVTGLRRHALKNALIPVVTISGYQFANLMAGALVLEYIYNIPGIGRALFDGIRARDYPVIQALLLLTSLVFLTLNLVVDMLYAFLNPRIRYG